MSKDGDGFASRHVLKKAAASRLRSQNSFLKWTAPIIEEPSDARITRWSERAGTQCYEDLMCGFELSYQEWTPLNRLRTGCPRTGTNLRKWCLQDGDNCLNCDKIQSHENLFACGGGTTQTQDDLWGTPDDAAIGVVLKWKGL